MLVFSEQETRQQGAALFFHPEREGANSQKVEDVHVWQCESKVLNFNSLKQQDIASLHPKFNYDM